MPIFVARDLDVEAAASEFMLPVMDGMEAIHFCNTSLEKAAHNYALGKPNAVVKGAPVPLTNYVQFNGNVNYLETRVQETPAQTVYCIGRTADDLLSDAERPMYVSTFTRPAAAGGGSTFGVALYHTDAGSGPIYQAIGSRGTSVSDDINGAVSLSTPSPNNWVLMAGLIKNANTKNELFNLTSGEHFISSAANTPRFPSLGYFRIGSGYSTAFAGACDIAFAAIASVAHTEDQIKANAAALRAYFDPRSIFI